MQTNTRLLRQVMFMTFIAFLGGTIGYYMIEDRWTVFDAFYMTFITLTTIGFSETHKLSPAGRAFTIVLVTFGLGVAAAFAAQFAHLLMDGSFSYFWRKRRMERTISRLKDHVIVCGYGRIGKSICQELTTMGATCVVVESSEERQAQARATGLAVMTGNATSDIALLGAGISRAAAIVAALSQDTDNVFVALSARDLNPEIVVIARAYDQSLEGRMLKAGVNRIVYPAQLGGGRIAHLVGEEIGLETESHEQRRSTDVLGYDLKIYRNISMKTQTLQEILKETGAIRALAVVRNDGHRQTDPSPRASIAEMEAVILLIDTTEENKERPRTQALSETDQSNLSVGVESIDAEHQQILSLIQRLESANPKSERRIINEVLDDLLEYTALHFRNEESIFLGTGYPEAEAHVEEHKALVKKVQLLVADKGHVHPANLAKLLNGWIVHHILEVDRGYIDYVQMQHSR